MISGKYQGNEYLSLMGQVREHLNRLDNCTATGLDKLLRELAHVILRPLPSMFEGSQQLEEIFKDHDKASVIPNSNMGPAEDQSSSPQSQSR